MTEFQKRVLARRNSFHKWEDAQIVSFRQQLLAERQKIKDRLKELEKKNQNTNDPKRLANNARTRKSLESAFTDIAQAIRSTYKGAKKTITEAQAQAFNRAAADMKFAVDTGLSGQSASKARTAVSFQQVFMEQASDIARRDNIFGIPNKSTLPESMAGIELLARRRAKEVLMDAVATGKSIGDTSKDLMSALDITDSAAARMARTNMNASANNAHWAAITDNPEMFIGGTWDATFDSRTCPTCAGLHGMFFGIDQNPPGPPAHPNCRCTLIPVLADEDAQIEAGKDGLKRVRNYTAQGEVKIADVENADTGFEDWLKIQPPNVQKSVLGTKVKQQLFAEGKIGLSDISMADGTLLKNRDVVRRAWAKNPNDATLTEMANKFGMSSPVPWSKIEQEDAAARVRMKRQNALGSPEYMAKLKERLDALQSLPQVEQAKAVEKVEQKSEKQKLFEKLVADGASEKAARIVSEDSGFSVGKDWEQTGGQMGGNKGGKFRDPKTGSEYYIKEAQDKDHADNEVLASKLYELAGVEVTKLHTTQTEQGTQVIASEWRDGLKKASSFSEENVTEARKHFATDAWLSNWDVVGLSNDNIQFGPDGKAVRVDVGGALKYRALGSPKGGAFGDSVEELFTLRDRNVNSAAAKVFGDISSKALLNSIRNVTAIKDEDIRALVGAFGSGSESEKKTLANKLIARRDDLKRMESNLEQRVQRGERGHMQQTLYDDKNIEMLNLLVPSASRAESEEIYKSLASFTGSGYRRINSDAKDGHKTSAIKNIDRFLSEAPLYPMGANVQRQFGLSKAQLKSYIQAGFVENWGYGSSTTRDHPVELGSGEVSVIMKVRRYNTAVSVKAFSEHASEDEVMFKKNARFRIVSTKKISDVRVEITVDEM